MPFAIERNDLATVEADAIVIAANEHLQITGGVGLTVARAAGFEELQGACDAIGFCPCGSAVATPGFGLHAKTVVHAVGPIWAGGGNGEVELLRSAYDSALQCAIERGARSIALPLISAGTYGFPANVSLAVAREAIRAFLNEHDNVEIRLVLYSRKAVSAGIEALVDIAEYVDDHYVDSHAVFDPYASRDALWQQQTSASFPNASYPSFAVDRQTAERQAPCSAPRPASSASSNKAARLPDATRERKGLFDLLGDVAERARERFVDRDSKRGHGYDAAATPDLPEAHEESTSPSPAIMPDALGDFGANEADDSVFFTGSVPFAPSYSTPSRASAPAVAEEEMPLMAGAPRAGQSLEDLLDSLDAPFSTTLLALIDERGMTDAQVYKRANMSRQLFSKIRSDAAYRPTKKTALALSVALELDLNETRDLLARAGFALSNSSKADVIVEYFISRGNHDIFEINEALYAFDQPLL